MNTNKIIEVENSKGDRFKVDEMVAHQDEDAGFAKIKKFEMSETHQPEIKAITSKGYAH